MTTSVNTRKVCFKCHVEKALTEFYVHPQMGDGRLNKCKECAKKDVRTNYEDNVNHYVAYDKARSQRPERKQAQLGYMRNRRKTERGFANNAVSNALRSGKLVRQPCEKCGDLKVDAHHDDYSKPLAVRWLCHRHHMEHHNKIARSA